MSEAFELRTIESKFVAEVSGVQLDQPLSAPSINAIKAGWAQHPVLIFPDQPLDPHELATFARHLGEFGIDPYVNPLEDHEHVIEVRREPAESTPIFGASWHSDWSFQAAPPSGTLLYAQTVPPSGGDTLFADCYRAYESLPSQLKSELLDLRATHSAARAYGSEGLFAKDDPSRSMRIVTSQEAEKVEIHPVVRTHPVTGRQGLFINHVYTIEIVGMDKVKSRALLKFLFEHMTQDEFVYQHEWREDMLVLWDNRCLLHYAHGGYAGYQRVMYRTTLAGERPA
jgi:taurine dioxygenase